jgi:hypothetical protein
MADPVQQQIDAYNDRDLEGFLAVYAEDAVLEDGRGNVMAPGARRHPRPLRRVVLTKPATARRKSG